MRLREEARVLYVLETRMAVTGVCYDDRSWNMVAWEEPGCNDVITQGLAVQR